MQKLGDKLVRFVPYFSKSLRPGRKRWTGTEREIPPRGKSWTASDRWGGEPKGFRCVRRKQKRNFFPPLLCLCYTFRPNEEGSVGTKDGILLCTSDPTIFRVESTDITALMKVEKKSGPRRSNPTSHLRWNFPTTSCTIIVQEKLINCHVSLTIQYRTPTDSWGTVRQIIGRNRQNDRFSIREIVWRKWLVFLKGDHMKKIAGFP